MGLLEDIRKMQQSGMSESGIVNNLREEGYSPKQISEGLQQFKIKNAISNPETEVPSPSQEQEYENQDTEENYARQQYPQQNYQQPQQQNYDQQYQQQPMPQQQDYDPQQNYQQPQQQYSQQDYPQYQEDYYQQEQYPEYQEQDPYQQQGYYQQESDLGTGRMIEVAEQVFDEKSKKMQDELNSLKEFKKIAETQINSTNERLKKIESVIDQLQAAILKKIGSYTSTLDSIKDEMSMMQDTFSKFASGKKTTKKKSSSKSSKTKK